MAVLDFIHRSLFGVHNGLLSDQYRAAAVELAAEGKLFRHELLVFRQHSKDPLLDLVRNRAP
jgi:hypothetical protein